MSEGKTKVTGKMRVRVREVLEHAVSDGVQYGWHRAHKHNDAPTIGQLQEAVVEGIMLAIDDWFCFDGEEVALSDD